MSRAAAAADIARTWIGTPYVHQASERGAGTDCLGLLRGVWREIFGQEPEPVPPYTPDWSEPQRDEILWRAAACHLIEIDRADLASGDVLLFRMKANSVAKHLGIVGQSGPCPTFVHAYCGHSVVESPLTGPWRRRIVACFEFPIRRD